MSGKSNKKLHIICLIAFVVLLCAAIWLLGKVLEPKYMTGVLEGAMTREYYDEQNAHDVIFVGDCEVYENFSPVTMWEEKGITSYIRGSAQQLIWQSYYLLEEAFERDSPKIVVYNVQSMKYDTPQSEAYNRMTIDGMPLSRHKLDAIKASMTEDEDMISYLIPFLRYHSRWSELTAEDFEYAFRRDPVTIAGYLMRADVEPMTKLPTAPVLDDYTIGDTCWEYLDKMQKLCDANGATLVLIKSPSLWPHWYDEWEEQMEEYAEENDLLYINFLDLIDEVGLDFQTDTYDGGLHLNLSGAEKLSRYFGTLLTEQTEVSDRRGEEALQRTWAEKRTAYDAEIAYQKEKYQIEK